MPKKRNHGDGALYYVKSKGLWRGVIDLPDPHPVTGKRQQKSVSSKSQKTCREKLDKLRDEIATHGAPADKTVTVEQWSRTWLADHALPHVDPNTYSGYASAVRRWIVPTIGHKKVGTLRPSDITDVHKRLRAAGRATSTSRGVHVVMSRMFEQARREGLCGRNVAELVDPPGGRGKAAGKRKARTREAIPLDDAAGILKTCADDDLASLWWLKMLGGPRQGELIGARIEDWDSAERTYYVRWKLEQVAKRHNCGQETSRGWPCGKKQGAACPDAEWRIPDDFEMIPLRGRWCLTRPKSIVGRAVPVIPQVADMIDDYIARHAGDPNPYGLIWRTPEGLPIATRDDAQEWRNLLHRAGVIDESQLAPGASVVDGHMARHTTVTLLASLGVDFQIIGEIVGHSSEEVTRIYRHANAKEKAQAMQRLGDLVLGTPRALEG